MSYIVLSDRIKETSRTIGTGSFSLEGAVQGFSSFNSAYSDGDYLFYAITDGTDYEVGSGIYATGVENQISRFPLRSSNSNNVVDFETGVKEVYVTYPATHSVYHASGFAGVEAPQAGGMAFWISNNVLGYDSSLSWDSGNNRLSINKLAPDYAIDIGGYGPDAIIKASGFIVGTSGVYFPTASNGDSGYDGGRQVVHFEPNDVLDPDSQTSIGVSGQVNQYIYFKEQPKGFVFAGPPSGCGDSCSPAVPQFRPLTFDDIPNLDSMYATDDELEAASGELSDRMMAISGIIISSGTQFINDLGAASGQLDSDIVTVSGMIDQASGVFDESVVTVSGMIDSVSGVFDQRVDTLNTRTQQISGVAFQNIDDIVTVSGMLDDASGVLNNDIIIVSGLAVAASGEADGGISLNESMEATSGIVIASGTEFLSYLGEVSGVLQETTISSGTQFLDDLQAASGSLFNAIEASSGVSNRFLVDLTGTENTALIKNDDLGEPTHFRLTNSNGVGSRLLLTSASGVDGNTWANVSLNDGAYRVYNYTYDWNIDVSGQPSSTEIILDSGVAWRELLPMSLVGASVSGTFLNNGHPSGVLIDSQYPASGHILTISAHPGQSLITSSPSLPEEVKIFSLGVNSIVATKENKFGLNLDPQAITSDLDIRGESVRIRNSGVITSASDAGYKGEIKWDENYIYVCVANNTWKRASLSTWP